MFLCFKLEQWKRIKSMLFEASKRSNFHFSELKLKLKKKHWVPGIKKPADKLITGWIKNWENLKKNQVSNYFQYLLTAKYELSKSEKKTQYWTSGQNYFFRFPFNNCGLTNVNCQHRLAWLLIQERVRHFFTSNISFEVFQNRNQLTCLSTKLV